MHGVMKMENGLNIEEMIIGHIFYGESDVNLAGFANMGIGNNLQRIFCGDSALWRNRNQES